MIVTGKQVCPTCGHAINAREVVLNKTLVHALWNVYRHCLATGKHEFERKDIDHLIPKGTAYANFGYWKWFSQGSIYTPTINGKTGRGRWGFNTQRLDKFFRGEVAVYTRLSVNGQKGNHRVVTPMGNKVTIDQIPKIQDLLSDGEYVAMYK